MLEELFAGGNITEEQRDEGLRALDVEEGHVCEAASMRGIDPRSLKRMPNTWQLSIDSGRRDEYSDFKFLSALSHGLPFTQGLNQVVAADGSIELHSNRPDERRIASAARGAAQSMLLAYAAISSILKRPLDPGYQELLDVAQHRGDLS